MTSKLPTSIDETVTLLRSTGYIAGRDLATVVFLSLKMGRPLFLEGEAGVGKTEIAKVLAETLDEANGRILEYNRSPARKVGEIDNRGSHFYLALYWAQALAARDNSSGLAARFKPIADKLSANEAKIYKELIDAQGRPQELGGYYRPDDAKTSAAMLPSATLNEALAELKG